MDKNFIKTYKPFIHPGIFHKKINSFHIITHPLKPAWIVVNDFGWHIIQLFTGDNSLHAISEIIQSQFNVTYKTIQHDLAVFISEIKKSGILDNQVPPTTPSSPCISSIFIHLTDKCNLHCKHCYTHDMSKNCDELGDDELNEFLKIFYASGGRAITLSGGEPLLRHNIKEIYKLSADAEIRLLTNGTLIDAGNASLLSKYNAFIQVSIDGSTAGVHDSIRGNGSFKAAYAGIQNLKQLGLVNKINLCTTIMKQNLLDLPNILQLAKSEGIRYVRYLPLRQKGSAQCNWDEIQKGLSERDYEQFYLYIYEQAIEQYPDIEISCGLSGYILDTKKLDADKHWCPIGKNLVIDTKGDVYPCVLFMDKKYKLGNIVKNNLNEIKENKILNKLMLAKIERKNKIEKCSTCMWKHFCQSSCMGLALEKHGTIWNTDAYCRFRKSLYEKNVIKMAVKKNSVRHSMLHTGQNVECF